MKKTFKRFLSSALAAVMVASSLVVGMVSNAYAADGVLQSTNTLDFTKLANITIFATSGDYYLDKDGNVLESETGSYFTVHMNGSRDKHVNNQYIQTQNDNDTISFKTTFPIAEVVIRASSKDSKTATISVKLNGTDMPNISVTGTAMDNKTLDLDEAGTVVLGGKNIRYESVTVKEYKQSGYTIVASENTYKGKFEFDPPAFEALSPDTQVTVSYVGDDYEMAPATFAATTDNFTLKEETQEAEFDVSKLTLNAKKYTAKVEQGKYTGEFTLSKNADIAYDEEFTLSYSGTDYKMTQQTFSVANKTAQMSIDGSVITITPDASWFAEIVEIGQVKQSDFGYEFASDTKKHLTTDSAYGGAYSDKETANNYIELNSDGALLYDNGTDTTTLEAPITIPESATKVTFSGTLTTVENTSKSWTLFAVNNSAGARVRIRVGSDKKIALQQNSSDGTMTSTDVAIADGTAYKFELVIDCASHEASLSINGGAPVTQAIDDNLTADALIKFTSATAGDAKRSLKLSNIAITTDAAEEESNATTVFEKDGTSVYAITVVKTNDVDTYSSITQKTAKNKVLATSDKVYNAVQIGGTVKTAEELGGNYVFASIITDVTDEDLATIKSSVKSFLK